MKRRYTQNKKQILDLFNDRHTLTTKEICTLLPKVERSTIYRNIERFLADGILRQVYVSQGVSTYELDGEAHDHFICNECKTIEEIHIRNESIRKSLPDGAIMQDGGVVVHGMCKDCSI